MDDEYPRPMDTRRRVSESLLVICDLDRMVIDCEARFTHAEQAHAKGTPEYWQAALDPDKLAFDLPLPGARAFLHQWRKLAGLCYVTSRPVACHDQTVAFLSQHGYPCAEQVICRPLRKGLTTPRFKGLTVRALTYGLSPRIINRHFRLVTHRGILFLLALWSWVRNTRKVVLFVDDSEKNRLMILKLGLAAYVTGSLEEANAWLCLNSNNKG